MAVSIEQPMPAAGDGALHPFGLQTIVLPPLTNQLPDWQFPCTVRHPPHVQQQPCEPVAEQVAKSNFILFLLDYRFKTNQNLN